jgi:hypothetical protein
VPHGGGGDWLASIEKMAAAVNLRLTRAVFA